MPRDKENVRRIKREWARRFRERETPEAKAARLAKKNAARNAKKWAANPNSKRKERPPGQCTACKQTFPNTAEFFNPLRVDGKAYLSAECRECRKKRFRKWYARDPAVQVTRAAAYVRDNPHAKAAKNNRDMVRYARRKKRGCPPWANSAHIEALYAIAADLSCRTGVPHEVDHVYPLIHPTSCGLHVPWNLRVVPAALNQAKGNRLPFDVGIVRDCTTFL